MKMSDKTMGGRFMGLFVGPPGTAKTVSAASFVLSHPEKSIYIFDLDGRVGPILKFYPDYLERIEYDTYGPKDFPKFKTKFESLQDRNPYSCVIVDGLTSLGDQLINYMLSIRGSSEGAASGKERGVISMAGPEDYGGEARGLSMMLDVARTLKSHFILTAHFMIIEYDDPITKKKFVVKQIVTAGKKIAAKVPIYFDEMYYFDTSADMALNAPPKYTVRTAGGTGFSAKTALPLPTSFDVTINKVGKDPYFYDILQGHLKKHNIDLEKAKKVQSL
jgi:hypothetical protein